jgi:hypothetical protein
VGQDQGPELYSTIHHPRKPGQDFSTGLNEGLAAQEEDMRFANFNLIPKALVASTFLAAAVAVHAQYSAPQPYDQNDPQNYSAPAQQAYGQQDQRYPNSYDQQADQQADQQVYQGEQSIAEAPPPLPSYNQPECPGDGYIWTPGYWAFGPAGYYWIPGSWVSAPYIGALWTPGYWGYGGGNYLWNVGYWGPTVGFYGGINYGFGYFGTGFYGGYWNSGHFFYNREYNRGRFNFGYTQRFPGVGGVHPGGRSFAIGNGGREGFRGGSYNRGGSEQHNFAQNGYANRGQQNYGPSRAGFGNGYGRQTAPQHYGNVFAGNGGRPAYNPPAAGYGGGRGYGGSYGGGQSRGYSAPQGGGGYHAPSAPSGGGGFHGGGGGFSGGGGGGNHGGGGGFSGGGGGGNHGGGGGFSGAGGGGSRSGHR